jgi:hypothetical protein
VQTELLGRGEDTKRLRKFTSLAALHTTLLPGTRGVPRLSVAAAAAVAVVVSASAIIP